MTSAGLLQDTATRAAPAATDPVFARWLTELERDHATFREVVAQAQEAHARGRLDVAAAYAQVAAHFAWFNHTGLFCSPELERLLDMLADALPAGDVPARRCADPATVLHVVTQVYQMGGPTQAVACWLEQDRNRRHRVALTRQGPLQIPPKILRRVKGGVDLVRVDARPGGLMQRAARLRTAAEGADVVVLHSHPYDVVPGIAFGGGWRSRPVIYVNHGDHVFWTGVAAADVIMSLRDSGSVLSIERRGVDASCALVAPRPLVPVDRSSSRAAAKARLNIDEHVLLVVTAADAPKYRPVSGPSLLEMILPLFVAREDVLLYAAGPRPEGEWAAAEATTNGRVRALGRLADVTLLHEAADVYLDSFPFSSLTSLLEAGSLGTPVVTYAGHPASCAVLGADTPGIDEHLLRPRTPAALRRDLARLLDDERLRLGTGTLLRDSIVSSHKDEGWRAELARIYASAAAREARPVMQPAPRSTGTLDLLVRGIMGETGFGTGLPGALAEHLGLLPFPTRLAVFARLARTGEPPPLRRILPEWTLPWLAPAFRAVRGVVRRERGPASRGAEPRASASRGVGTA